MRIDLLGRMAAYNRWANERLYATCGSLGDNVRKQARAAFFGSIHATLNHILLTDRIWLARILEEPPIELPLNAILFDDFDDLQAARCQEDQRIVDFVGTLREHDLDRSMRYRTSSGAMQENPLELTLQHLFNHQTHHRGQVHDMLSAVGAAPPSLDLINYARATSGR